MQTIIKDLAIILPGIAIFCILLIILVNVCIKVRRLFPVKVNCWFCNHWTKVHYDIRNCFECPACLQYNGFNSEGDYNKPIPAQHESLLNNDVKYNCGFNSSPTATNGLCSSCNNNLRLKVFQVANFVPLHENNYDSEIEHFEQQLDKSYKLCSKCEVVVKTTLRKQNEALGIKLPCVKRIGMRLLDYRSYTNTKRSFIIKLIAFVLVTIAFCNIMYILSSFDYSNDNLRQLSPKRLYPYLIRLKQLYVDLQNSAINFYNSLFPQTDIYTPFFLKKANEVEYNAKLMCILGTILQLVLILLSENGIVKKLIQILAWGLLVLLSWNYPIFNVDSRYAEIILNIVVITSICFKWNSGTKQSISNKKWSNKISRQNVIYTTEDPAVKKVKKSPFRKETKPDSEMLKPNFLPNIKLPKHKVNHIIPKETLQVYNQAIPERSLNLPEDLVKNLTNLNLGKTNLLPNSNYENPFLLIRSPLSVARRKDWVLSTKNPLHSKNEIRMPSKLKPSTFTLKLQFSAHNPKF